MPFVHVHWFEGRSDEQKAEIAKRITDALSEVGGSPPEEVWIRFDDSPKSNWTFGGERKQ
jgi:4-oxalocrotonate tautomerase